MSKGVHGSRIIDLRKRRVGVQFRAARARAQAELPLHPRISLRSRRRKLRALMAFVVLIVGAGAVYGVSEFSYMSRYSITNVSVGGTGSVSPNLVRAFVETKLNDGNHPIISRENIFLYPKTDIAKGIAEYFPRILSAKISRETFLAQAITVIVVERKPFALWCSGGKVGNSQVAAGEKKEAIQKECFQMDESGFIFAPLEVSPQERLHAGDGLLTGFEQSATSTSEGEIIFTGGLAGTAPIGQTFLQKHFESVLTLLSRLKDEGFSATGVSVENEQDFAVSLSNGFVLRASFGVDASALVRNLQTVLSSGPLLGKENKIEYIDLRFGNRVYYKNKAGSQ
ncbi:MAG: hypothetical protein Q7S08_03270 [bacterium]|nr:hypothetical protein [bacterium]